MFCAHDLSWLLRAEKRGAPMEDQVRVRRALGHLIIEHGGEAVKKCKSEWTFQAAEILYGLSPIPQKQSDGFSGCGFLTFQRRPHRVPRKRRAFDACRKLADAGKDFQLAEIIRIVFFIQLAHRHAMKFIE